jgi:hypothetical protein
VRLPRISRWISPARSMPVSNWANAMLEPGYPMVAASIVLALPV